mgnify:FL=1
MDRKIIDMNHPMFLPIKEAVKVTGLSEYYFRQNLKAGKIPHIRCGSKILINMPLLEAELERLTTSTLVKL